MDTIAARPTLVAAVLAIGKTTRLIGVPGAAVQRWLDGCRRRSLYTPVLRLQPSEP